MEKITIATGRRTAYQFPQHFLWGAATAAHQVEGDNRWNDWWEYEQAGRLPHQSGACCSHYEFYEQDFDLARGLGHNCHRFSVEWSRIEPAQGQWDEQALQHYRKVVQALRQRALEPVLPAVTCTVQSTLVTGLPPSGHGAVANGWYFRDMAEVMLWRQSNRLVAGEKSWEAAKARDPDFTCAKMVWWYNMYATADWAATPRPR